ncbi:MAG: hypothetical protein OXU20_02240 [Myxococcales bacterium]|nr:hypothetical protein [Myxococcales bacterium]
MSDISRQPSARAPEAGSYSSTGNADNVRQTVLGLVSKHLRSVASASATLEPADKLVELGLSSIELLNIFVELDMMPGFDITKISLEEPPRSIADLLLLAGKMHHE